MRHRIQRVLVGVAGQHQEAVVVQACKQVRLGRIGQALTGLGHQPLEGGIAIALAQAQRTGDLDEEQAAAIAVRE